MENRANILLVEDNANDAELIVSELTKAHLLFEASKVDKQKQFLQGLDEFQPHVILADYSLPQFTALDALRLLRQKQSEVPLILVTGSHSEEVAVECMKEGAEDYILKSSLKRLPSALQKTLHKRAAER